MSGILYTPDIGAKINQEDVAAEGVVDASWLLYNGSSDGSPVALGTVAQSSPIDRGLDMAILSSTRAVIAMPDSNNSQFGTAVLIDISGTTASVLDTFVFQSIAMEEVKIATVDSRYAVVYYLDSGGTERGRVIDTDSDTLANVGSEQNLSGTINIGVSVGGRWDFEFIDTDEHVGVFRNESASSNLYGLVIGINTGTGALTLNSAVQLSVSNLSNSLRVGMKALSTTVFLMNGNFGVSPNDFPQAITGSKSGTTISAGTNQQVASIRIRQLNNPSVNDAGDTVYSSSTSSADTNPGVIQIIPVSGTTLSSPIARGTAVNTTASNSVNAAYMLYMETIGTLEYFVGISYDGSVDDFAFSGFEFDTDTELLRHSGTFTFAAIRGDAIDNCAIEKISSDKVILAGKDSNNSNRVTMYTANRI